MTTQQVIDAYVEDVVRRLPARDRHDVAMELQGLLAEMLEGRAQEAGRAADDAMVLAMLRGFGLPAEVARRYQPPGIEWMSPAETRQFALVSIAGVLLQWALTLPQVFEGALSPAGWWLGMGLGAFWWPGFLAMFWLLGAWFRHKGWLQRAWRPRLVDPDRVDRRAIGLAMVGIAVGAGIVSSLPWLAQAMHDPFPRIFAFDPTFLRERAWVALPLWASSLATLALVLSAGRWTPLARRIELVSGVAYLAMMGWWLAAGPIFVSAATDECARGALVLVMLVTAIGLVAGLRRRHTAATQRATAG